MPHLFPCNSDIIAAPFAQSILQATILAAGFSFGGISLISLLDGEVLFFISPDSTVSGSVTRMAFAEPENDPKATLYLWAGFDATSARAWNEVACVCSFMEFKPCLYSHSPIVPRSSR